MGFELCYCHVSYPGNFDAGDGFVEASIDIYDSGLRHPKVFAFNLTSQDPAIVLLSGSPGYVLMESPLSTTREAEAGRQYTGLTV
jgi:hypothetical protein